MSARRRRGRWRAAGPLLVLLLPVLLLAACAGSGKATAAATTASVATSALSRATLTGATPGATPATPTADLAGDWLRFGYDPARQGVNPNGTAITPQNVGSLHQLYRVRLPSNADSSPAFLHGLTFPDGAARDVVYVETRDGRLIALDAADGSILWQHQPTGPNVTNSSPLADPDRDVVYAYGLDGYLHQYQAVSGAEVTGNGWPVQITKLTQTEKESSAPNEANGKIYVTTSGYLGDAPPYQGHVVVIDPATGTSQVFNSLCADRTTLLSANDCSAERSGIWARAGAVVDPVDGSIYVTTGNAPFDPANHNYGDSVLRLSGDGTNLLDSYTPTDYQRLDAGDIDLGSTAPALLPRIPGSTTPLLAVQGGKDGKLRLLNRQDMSGQGGPGHTGGELQLIDSAGCATFTQPVVWTAPDGTLWLIVAGTCALAGYKVVTDQSGTTRLELGWKTADQGTTPVLANGILFLATDDALLALDPASGTHLWSSAETTPKQTIGTIHWESPIVVGNRIFIADEENGLSAFGP